MLGGPPADSSHPGAINNVFQANKAGVANFETFGTPGAMTFFGVAQECTLPLPQSPVVGTFEYEIFVVVYHVDNRSWGPLPGPTETYTGHLIFLLP